MTSLRQPPLPVRTIWRRQAAIGFHAARSIRVACRYEIELVAAVSASCQVANTTGADYQVIKHVVPAHPRLCTTPATHPPATCRRPCGPQGPCRTCECCIGETRTSDRCARISPDRENCLEKTYTATMPRIMRGSATARGKATPAPERKRQTRCAESERQKSRLTFVHSPRVNRAPQVFRCASVALPDTRSTVPRRAGSGPRCFKAPLGGGPARSAGASRAQVVTACGQS